MILETGMMIAAVAGCTMGDLLLDDPLTSDSGAWTTTRGAWSFSDDGLRNAHAGDNRLHVDVLAGHDDYTMEFAATLERGKGWGVWLSAGLDGRGRVSGYSFQHEPWRDGSYTLSSWIDNRDSLLLATDLASGAGEAHDFRIAVESDRLTVFADGEEVMSYVGLDRRDGDLIGFRTWAESIATFAGLVVTSSSTPVPGPGAASVALGVLGLVVCARRRTA